MDWEVLEDELVLSNSPWIELRKEKVKVNDSVIIEDFYRVILPEFSLVYATTIEGKIVTVSGYKHGPKKVSVGLPGGLLEPNESPLSAAKREFEEETGYQAENYIHLGSYVIDGNRQCGKAHFFKANNAIKVGLENQVDQIEKLHIELKTLSELKENLRNGEVVLVGSAALIALANLF